MIIDTKDMDIGQIELVSNHENKRTTYLVTWDEEEKKLVLVVNEQ